MKNNKNINKIITLGMAGAVALSTPLSFIYASDDVIIDDGIIEVDPDTSEDDVIIDVPTDTETENTESTGIIIDDATSESTETESTETTEEPNEKVYKDFSFFIKGYNTASDEDVTNIYNKLKTDGKYKLSYSDNKTEKDLKVKVNIYNNNDEIIDNFVLSNSDNIIKNLPDEDEQGHAQFSCKYELVADNLHYTKNNKCFMYSSIITEDGKIPVLKFFELGSCKNHGVFESPVHIEKELGIVCDYNNPDFDLDLFLENEEIENFFFSDVVVDKDCCCVSGIPDLPDLPDIPETSETTETTESTEEPSTETTETPSTETSETTEEPSTETTETPSTETSETTEEPSTETMETPSTETSETTEEPSTETTETPSTETSETTEEPSTETTETPSTETSETTEEPSTETTTTPSTETSETTEEPSTETTETPSTETSETTEEPSTETTTTPTPQPITEDRGKVDLSEKNEMVQTGDIATNTYYGGYFLATSFAVLGAFFKKFKK